MSKLGFVGLGIMGTPWPAISQPPAARSSPTIRSRFPPSWSPRPDRKGITSKEVANRRVDVFFVMVRTPHVWRGPLRRNGAAEGLQAGTIVVDMSSIADPEIRTTPRRSGARLRLSRQRRFPAARSTPRTPRSRCGSAARTGLRRDRTFVPADRQNITLVRRRRRRSDIRWRTR